ncbi:MAG: N-acetyltransferase [Gemmatimonadetes bacterium]|nr:N-acetyltransferase [Gemmatimonadota bacterium]
MDLDVQHHPDERRFVAVVEGNENYLSYAALEDGALDFRHTWVDPSLRGRGVGERIVRTALEHAREHGLQVVPSCWYVGAVVRRHPEYRPLLR